jgi:hypothetical protein
LPLLLLALTAAAPAAAQPPATAAEPWLPVPPVLHTPTDPGDIEAPDPADHWTLLGGAAAASGSAAQPPTDPYRHQLLIKRAIARTEGRIGDLVRARAAAFGHLPAARAATGADTAALEARRRALAAAFDPAIAAAEAELVRLQAQDAALEQRRP